MTEINSKLEDAIIEFQAKSQGKVTPEMAVNLRACIESSPELLDQMNLAVAKGHLKAFALMPDESIAGGMYDPDSKTMLLSRQSLATTPDKSFNHDLAFVLGHETQHGFNLAERSKVYAQASLAMRGIARDANLDNRYDQPIDAMLQARRLDEGKASLAGWNAAVSQRKQEGQQTTLEAMYKAYPGRARDFVDELRDPSGKVEGYRLKDGIALKDDMTVDVESKDNIAALGRYYYDNPLRQVGKAHSNYVNYDATSILSNAIYYQRKDAQPESRMLIDMQRHGFLEEKLEVNGLSLRTGIERNPRQRYFDSSGGQLKEGWFDHTYDARVSADQVNQYVPITPAMTSRRRGFDDPKHPENALYAELKERLPPGTSSDRVAQITFAASRGGIQAGELNRVDVTDTAVYVSGAIPGDKAMVDLTKPPLAQAQTEQQHDALERQRAQQFQPPEPPPPQQNNPTIHR